jgi:hypothetical protein
MEIHPKIGWWNCRDERLNRSAVSVQLQKQMSYFYWKIYIYIHLWLHFIHIIYIYTHTYIYVYIYIRIYIWYYKIYKHKHTHHSLCRIFGEDMNIFCGSKGTGSQGTAGISPCSTCLVQHWWVVGCMGEHSEETSPWYIWELSSISGVYSTWFGLKVRVSQKIQWFLIILHMKLSLSRSPISGQMPNHSVHPDRLRVATSEIRKRQVKQHQKASSFCDDWSTRADVPVLVVFFPSSHSIAPAYRDPRLSQKMSGFWKPIGERHV